MPDARVGHKTLDSPPAPLTPTDCDLRDFAGMMIDVSRLRQSKQWLIAKRRPDVGFYAMNLWLASWHKLPTASIEDDDDVLCDAAMCDPKKWPKVRADVMRGWVKCADGRLYHPIVAIKALEAWLDKLSARKSSDAGNCKRYKRNFDEAPHDLAIAAATRALLALDANAKKAVKFAHLLRSEFPALPPPDTLPPGGDRESQNQTPGSQEKGTERKGSESLPSEECCAALSARVREVAGQGLGEPSDVEAIQAALDAGCDLELDILPIVKAKTARARASPIANWSYFAKAWVEARDARLNPPPPATPKPRNGKRHDRPKPKANAFVAAALNRAGANTSSDDVIDAEFEVREG